MAVPLLATAAASNPELTEKLIDKGTSTVGKMFKIGAIAIGSGLAAFLIYKIVKKVKKKTELKKSDEKAKQAALEKGYDDSKVTLKDSEIDTIVKNLKSAFKGWFGQYDESAIRGELTKLRNKHDWYAVEEAFGVMEKGDQNWRLVDWLNDDGSSDRKSYREILDKIQVTGILKL